MHALGPCGAASLHGAMRVTRCEWRDASGAICDARRADLGASIINFARIVPDGLLVFFPSYGVMKSCIDGWKEPGLRGTSSIWDRICK
jgi:hypothetical protein